MEELVAKRYIKALQSSIDSDSMENISVLFESLADEFKNDKFVQIMNNPQIDSLKKKEILLDAVKSAKSDKVNNFISLLVENRRIEVIPSISKELKKAISAQKRVYVGKVFSNGDIDNSTISNLSEGLSKKVDAKISLEFVKNDFDGIKVEVEDLGLEINLSKTRMNSQLINHILKAI